MLPRDPLFLNLLITTSRPSALGVLNIKLTEFDKKIILSGIKRQSVETMVQRYCAKWTNKEDVLKCLEDLEAKDIENMPLVLKQIVWLLGKGIKIAPGISGLYSDILTIAVKWAYDKYKQEISHFEHNSKFAKLKLPEQLSKAPSIEECQYLVFSLSEIAFEMLSTDSEYAFGRSKLSKYGIDDSQLKALLGVGLLSEENFENPMKEDTQFCFPHTSFIEYFSAVFITSQVESCRTSTDAAENHPDSTNVLTEFFRKYRSIEDVLSMEIVLKFVCGLAPNLTQFVCQNIFSIAQSSEGKIRTLHFDILWKAFCVQRFIAECVTECKKISSSVTLHLPIRDLFVTDESFLKIRDHIEGQSVQHLFASNLFIIFFKGHIRDSTFSVDCSNFKYLNTVGLVFSSSTQTIILQNLQITRLESVTCLEQLIPELLKGEPCKNLQQIYLCKITLHCHSEVSGLLNLIARTTTLRAIEIFQLKCSECDEHCRHVMDLSKHDKLQTLKLVDTPAIHVMCINKSNLESVDVDQHYFECVRALKDSQKLNNLILAGDKTVFTKEMNEDICTCTQLQHLRLKTVNIQDGALQLDSCMEKLSDIELFDVSMSESTFVKFMESLLTLRQSVEVTVHLSEDCVSERSKYKTYIQNNPKRFKILPHTMFELVQMFPLADFFKNELKSETLVHCLQFNKVGI